VIIGTLLGIGWLAALINTALEIQEAPVYFSYALAGGVLAFGFLLGIVFIRTVGAMTFGIILGGAIGAVIVLVKGEWAHVPGFLLVAAAGWIVASGQKARFDATRGIPPGF